MFICCINSCCSNKFIIFLDILGTIVAFAIGVFVATLVSAAIQQCYNSTDNEGMATYKRYIITKYNKNLIDLMKVIMI